MNSNTSRTMLCSSLFSFAIVAAGCAGAKVADQSQQAPITSTRPDAVVIYPFAVSPSEVTLNQGFLQREYREMSGKDQTAEELQIADQTAHNVCVQVATNLLQRASPLRA